MPRHLLARVLRRLRSASLVASGQARSWLVRVVAHHFQEGITIGGRVYFGSDVILSATDSGLIRIGSDARIGRTSRLVARQGRISIGDGALLADGCIVVSLASIEIGEGSQIAEYVVIRDQDHDVTRRPFSSDHFESAPIVIGRDCWIGAKATILKGARIGDGAVIGAHSVVRGEIPANSLAVGTPARVVKEYTAAGRTAAKAVLRQELHSDATA
jgi:acetyltransferase-like isoleucine patch superfamily enzyme